MNYYVEAYEGLYVLPGILILAIAVVLFLLGFLGLYGLLGRVFSPLRNKVFYSALSVVSAVVISCALMYLIPYVLLNGRIHRCYLTEVDQQKRLSIWFTKEESAGMSEVYTQRFVSYDLYSGEELGRINPVWRFEWDDYQFYGPFGAQAWGYSADTNLQLLDLFTPKILHGAKAIVEQHPELGSNFRLTPSDSQTNWLPQTRQISIVSEQGEIFWLSPDLSLGRESDRKQQAAPSWKTIGRAQVLATWNSGRELTANTWAEKPVADPSGSGCNLAYLDARGHIVNRLDICKMFHTETRPYGVLHVGEEVFLFVTRKGYSLTALITDLHSGAIKRTVSYFN